MSQRIGHFLAHLAVVLERLEGCRGPERQAGRRAWPLVFWWAFLLFVIFAASGRGTRFIYVDF